MKYSIFFFNWLFVVKKKKRTLGLGRALNLTVPLRSGGVGSDDLGYGPGSGFSLKPVQTSRRRPCWCIWQIVNNFKEFLRGTVKYH